MDNLLRIMARVQRSLSLVWVVLLVKQNLVVDDRRDCLASEKPSIEAIFGFLSQNLKILLSPKKQKNQKPTRWEAILYFFF